MNKRTAHRWRLLAIMLGAVFCAFGSFWLLQVVTEQDRTVQIGKSNEPDYIIDNFSFVRMGKNGQPSYVVSGDRLTHRPIEDISYVDKPVVQGMTTEHPRMTMHADRARILHEQDQVELIGNVDVERPGTATVKPLSIKTEELTVLPDEEIMKTEKPVEMKLGAATVRGTGMVANNATQKVHLARQSHIEFPPRDNR
ncbi:MAG: LPS export ABC transporter periplasmic protein LptC [Telluria sp.]